MREDCTALVWSCVRVIERSCANYVFDESIHKVLGVMEAFRIVSGARLHLVSGTLGVYATCIGASKTTRLDGNLKPETRIYKPLLKRNLTDVVLLN